MFTGIGIVFNFLIEIVGCGQDKPVHYMDVVGNFWALEVVGYWLLVNVQSPTLNNPQPQLSTTSNGQKVPTPKNYQLL
ncbi:hypothetical protein BpHYR1_042591 [Brachionus plicatilis]|uniref:Uncharacterized protein n=1 Tax=Brachionus plicatilis TaxID=10195 RepID=A0A3M7QLB6_BRAPC|nr:hypothetical protein BpHYR1_042591 [Brachionus plicatilis]